MRIVNIVFLILGISGCAMGPAAVAPTPPPTATVDEAALEAAYNAFVLGALAEIGAGLDSMSSLAQQIAKDASVLEESAWQAEFEGAVDRVTVAAGAVRDYQDVPWRYSALHSDLVEVVGLYERGALLMHEGVGERNADKMDGAAALLRAGVERAGALVEELRSLGA